MKKDNSNKGKHLSHKDRDLIEAMLNEQQSFSEKARKRSYNNFKGN